MTSPSLTEPLNDDDALPMPVVRRKGIVASDAINSSQKPSGGIWIRLILGGAVILLGWFLLPAVQERVAGAEAVVETEELPCEALVVVALGRLEPEGEVIEVSGPSGSGEARIQSLEVEEGDEVAQGDMLAVLDSMERRQSAVEVAEASLEQAHTQLALTTREVQTTRNQLVAALRMAEAKLETAEKKVLRQENLVRVSAVSRDSLEDAQLEVSTTREALIEAGARVARYEESADGESVDVALGRREIALAEASLREARANLELAQIRAPMDGTILRINLRPGEQIGQDALLEMGRVKNMMARVEVYESDVRRIQTGQLVELSARALSEPLTGSVERVSTLIRRQEIVQADPAANTDARVMEVWVRLDEASSAAASSFVNLQVRARFQP